MMMNPEPTGVKIEITGHAPPEVTRTIFYEGGEPDTRTFYAVDGYIRWDKPDGEAIAQDRYKAGDMDDLLDFVRRDWEEICAPSSGEALHDLMSDLVKELAAEQGKDAKTLPDNEFTVYKTKADALIASWRNDPRIAAALPADKGKWTEVQRIVGLYRGFEDHVRKLRAMAYQ